MAGIKLIDRMARNGPDGDFILMIIPRITG